MSEQTNQQDQQEQEPVRAFSHVSQEWSAQFISLGHHYADAVEFGLYDPDGGARAEMRVTWYDLSSYGSRETLFPRLEAFDDAWAALAAMPDVLAALAERDGKQITPEQFVTLLQSLGFADHTRRENPYSATEPNPAS